MQRSAPWGLRGLSRAAATQGSSTPDGTEAPTRRAQQNAQLLTRTPHEKKSMNFLSEAEKVSRNATAAPGSIPDTSLHGGRGAYHSADISL